MYEECLEPSLINGLEINTLIHTKVESDTIKFLANEQPTTGKTFIEVLYLFKDRSISNFTIAKSKFKKDVVKYVQEKCIDIYISSEVKEPTACVRLALTKYEKDEENFVDKAFLKHVNLNYEKINPSPKGVYILLTVDGILERNILPYEIDSNIRGIKKYPQKIKMTNSAFYIPVKVAISDSNNGGRCKISSLDGPIEDNTIALGHWRLIKIPEKEKYFYYISEEIFESYTQYKEFLNITKV